jgi:hypothetical protein
MNMAGVMADRGEERQARVAGALRAEWRMIASVSLRPSAEGQGFEADVQLDPIVLRGSLEQQGHPQTPSTRANLEARRHAALGECVRSVNVRLPPTDQIKTYSVVH